MKKVIYLCSIIGLLLIILVVYIYLYIPMNTVKNFVRVSYSMNYNNLDSVLLIQKDYFSPDFLKFISTKEIIDIEEFKKQRLIMRLCSPIRFRKVEFDKGIIIFKTNFQIEISNREKTINNLEIISLNISLKRIKWNEYQVSFIKQNFN